MIKTIVFDFGNVLADFDLTRFVQRLHSNTSASRQEVRRLVSGSKLEKDYSRGRSTTEHFLKHLKTNLGLTMSPKEIAKAYTSIFETNKSVQSLVKKLKDNYRLQLYSDTCPLHYERVIKHTPVFPLFDAVTVSFKVGALKEKKTGFKEVIRQSHCAPAEVVYTDDIEGYVERAKSLGIKAICFNNVGQLKQDLRRLGVIEL